MAFDFPASPSVGQVYGPPGGPSYTWDGVKWTTTGSSPIGMSGPPQGRLTLTAGAPVMTANVVGATTVRYTTQNGRLCPAWDGNKLVMYDFLTELTQALTDATKSPAAAVANKNYDIFFWMDGTTARISRGPAWTSDTSRGTGAGSSDLTQIFGLKVNFNAITNGPAAQRGTYLGTIRTNASALVDHTPIVVSGSGGALCTLGVWNCYNRIAVRTGVTDNGVAYGYAAAAIRQARASTLNQINLVVGLAEDGLMASYQGRVDIGNTAGYGNIYIGLDSTTVGYRGTVGSFFYNSAAGALPSFGPVFTSVPIDPQIGYHSVTALELASGSVTATFCNNPSLLSLQAQF